MTTQHSAPSPVLYVMDTLGLSGRTKGIIDLALHLDPKRYRPIFCSLGEETSELARKLEDRGIPIEMMPIDAGLRPDGVWKLVQLIRRHGIKVVHPVNPRPLLYTGLAARLTGIRAAIGSLSAFACQVPDRTYTFLPQELANRGRKQALRNQASCQLMRNIVAVSEELGERFCRFTADAAGPLSGPSTRSPASAALTSTRIPCCGSVLRLLPGADRKEGHRQAVEIARREGAPHKLLDRRIAKGARRSGRASARRPHRRLDRAEVDQEGVPVRAQDDVLRRDIARRWSAVA